MSESNYTKQTHLKCAHKQTHTHTHTHTSHCRMSKSKDNHSTCEFCTVALSFFLNDLLLVTQNGTITVVLLPLQTKEL